MTLKSQTVIGRERASENYEIMNCKQKDNMFLEKNAELCNTLFQQCFPFTEMGKMHDVLSKKVLSEIVRLIFQGRDVPASTISLRPLTRRNFVSGKDKFWLRIQHLLELRSKKLKATDSSDLPSYPQTKSPDEVDFDPKGNISEKIPYILLKDVLSSQGSISKTNFMSYFGLQDTNSEMPTTTPHEMNSSSIKLSQAAFIPLSSDLGRIMASKDNLEISEEFKLRKIDRYEWYVNKPYDKKVEDIEYPVTYKSNERRKPATSSESRRPVNNLKRMKMKCKPLSVRLQLVDLRAMRQRMNANARRRIRRRKIALLKKCKKMSVIVQQKEKLLVDHFIKKMNGNHKLKKLRKTAKF